MIKLGLFEGTKVEIDDQKYFLFLDRKQLVKVVYEDDGIQFYYHWLNLNCADKVEYDLSEISSLNWKPLWDFNMDFDLYINFLDAMAKDFLGSSE